VCHDRVLRGPERARPGLDVALDVVGVKIDEAGKNAAVGAIDERCTCRPLADRRDQAVLDVKIRADNVIAKNQRCAAEYRHD
jgi:hypothetical protein